MTNRRTTTDASKPLQPRAIETRKKLLAVGLRAFTDLGHGGVNIKTDILVPSGISPSSFYHQFEDKTDLLLAVLEECAEQRRASVIGAADAVPTTLEEAVRLMFERVLDSVADDSHGWRAQQHVQWLTEPRIQAFVASQHQMWRDRLTLLFAHVTGADEDRSRRGATTFFSLGWGLALTYLDLSDDERSSRREVMLDDAVSVVVGGLGSLLAPPDGESATE